jgi:hypothetical protein
LTAMPSTRTISAQRHRNIIPLCAGRDIRRLVWSANRKCAMLAAFCHETGSQN